MNIRMTVLTALAGLLLVPAGYAAEITVLSAGAIEPGLKAAVTAYQKASGDAVKISFATAPQIQKRLEGSETWDVLIAPPAILEGYAKSGKVGAESVALGRVGMGVAVRPGADLPDISSAEALKRAILNAESIVFNRASTGLSFEKVLKQMGISAEVEGKTTRYADGAAVMEHVLKGHGREIGFGPITEILLQREKGLRLVGPFPAEVQNYTAYSASLMSSAAQRAAARNLVEYLGSPAGKAIFVAAGVE